MECAIEQEELPVPVVMRRISDLLAQKLQLRPAQKQQLRPAESSCSSSGGNNSYTKRQRSTTRTCAIEEFRNTIRAMESTSGPIYVDLQCLNSNEGYVIKEFAAKCAGVASAAWIMIRSPSGAFPIARDNSHLLKSVHGISWDAGDIDECQLKAYTRRLFNNRPVFVKGQQKLNLLATKLGVPEALITSLDTYPSLNRLRSMFSSPPCLYHRRLDNSFLCATKHTHAL